MSACSIRIGPAGSDGLGYAKALSKAARMGLDCMEVAFTYGVRMEADEAEAVGAAARARGIRLSVHAPYYINLAADDRTKLTASKERILASCRMAALMGARNVVFHAGFYQGHPAEKTFDRIVGHRSASGSHPQEPLGGDSLPRDHRQALPVRLT